MPAEIFAHSYQARPLYQLFVYARPSNSGKGRAAYMSAVKSEAKRRIPSPIQATDVEVSMLYSSRRSAELRIDIDNTLKPTLDALCGVAFADDRQVRAVTARLIDRTGPIVLGFEDKLGHLLINSLMHGGDDVVIVHIYSDTRLREEGYDVAERRLVAEGAEETDAIRRRVLSAG